SGACTSRRSTHQPPKQSVFAAKPERPVQPWSRRGAWPQPIPPQCQRMSAVAPPCLASRFFLFLGVPPGDKYIVGNGVPGVVNADEKQQQRRGTDAKQRLARVGWRSNRRHNEHGIDGHWQKHLKQHILELRLV